jgi:hypothetical protein
MGVLVPWDFHSGEFIQTRISRKAGYGHIGYTLDEIELMFSNVVNAIDDVSRLKAMKPFETLASRILNEEDGKVDGAILGMEFGLDLFSYGSEHLHAMSKKILMHSYNALRYEIRNCPRQPVQITGSWAGVYSGALDLDRFLLTGFSRAV